MTETAALTDAERIEAIHRSPWKGVFAITGGGAGAIFELQKNGGSSATILEVTIPYATQSFISYVGGQPDKFCSSEGARALAMASFQRALRLEEHARGQHRFGMGVSCSLAKGLKKDERAGRENHFWIATQTVEETHVQHFVLPAADREQQEGLVSAIICDMLYTLCTGKPLKWSDYVLRQYEKRQASWAIQQIVLGSKSAAFVPEEDAVCFCGSVMRDHSITGSCTSPRAMEPVMPSRSLIFSGSFNPIHDGHLAMAQFAGKEYQKPVYFELSIRNATKPPLDYIEISKRVADLESKGVEETYIALSGAPTFAEKAALYPQPIFIVGFDTWARILDPAYSDNSVEKRDAALALLQERGAKFIVFGRVNRDGSFQTPENHPLIERIVAESEFRADVSSTKLRIQ